MGLPAAFDRFRSIQHCDFEFRQDCNHQPVPVSMFVKEHRTGRTIFMRRGELLTCREAPFDIGPDDLFVCYSAPAELGCFRVLNWTPPRNILCAYTELSAIINGRNDIAGLEEKRPSLLEACDLFNIQHTSIEHKVFMRDLILDHDDYTEEQWQQIEQYNGEDVAETILLLEAIASAIDLPAALFRGRYLIAATASELTGLPVHIEKISDLTDRWLPIRLHYINRYDDFDLYDEGGHFQTGRMEDLVADKRWLTWPRTSTGKLQLNSKVIGKQVRYHRELENLKLLRDQIAELRLGAFLNTIGADGFSRCPLMPFWTRSGRNQPQGRDKAFLPSLPAWVLGLISPPPGWGVVELDWSCQEIGFSAAFSGDPAMIVDFKSGDFHTMFAIRSGLAPSGATKKSLGGTFRRDVKAVSFGACYGMTKYGAAAKTGKSLLWAADILARHKHTYPVFARWQQSVAYTAIFDQQIVSQFGWPMVVHAETKHRTLYNYMQQAGGGDCLRIAMSAGHEAGVRICAPVHDALWIMAPINELKTRLRPWSTSWNARA
jgi:hypothetical protein